MMRLLYLVIALTILWVTYDFSSRVWTPLNYEDPSLDNRKSSEANETVEQITSLPESVEIWFKDEPKPVVKEQNTGPTPEQIAAREQQEKRKRMTEHGVTIGDYVFVLRGVSIGKANIAVLEVLAPENDNIVTELVALGDNYNGFRLASIEPLSVAITKGNEQVVVPLFKN